MVSRHALPPPPRASALKPRYPIYLPSKGRWQIERAITARILARDEVPFILAVESTEVDQYRALCRELGVSEEYVHDVGFSDLGQGAVPVRNWITDHARDNGFERQWQIDDNCEAFARLYRGERFYCRSGLALRICEDFTDRYDNVALSGLNYWMFGSNTSKPFVVNVHVYSCTLINTAIPYRWRGPYNDDTDLCLQCLAGGWCTILLNAFLVKKMPAFNGTKRSVLGGMTSMYEADGRLRMARCLERRWPYVVTTSRRFQRPQHVVRNSWRCFDTPLKLKEGVDLSAMPKVDEYGMEMIEVAPIRSSRLREIRDSFGVNATNDD